MSARLPTLPLASSAAILPLSVIGVFVGTTSHYLSGPILFGLTQQAKESIL
jgi:hypothetical protein